MSSQLNCRSTQTTRNSYLLCAKLSDNMGIVERCDSPQAPSVMKLPVYMIRTGMPTWTTGRRAVLALGALLAGSHNLVHIQAGQSIVKAIFLLWQTPRC